MLLAGLTKVRNESHIIEKTLDHYAKFCQCIYVYDDCSTDNTAEICEKHPAVRSVVRGKEWNSNRFLAEFQTRQAVLEEAQKYVHDWFIYFDADEFVEFDFNEFYPDEYEGVRMRLFDYYITNDDVNEPFYNRQWIGTEYRHILMMFRNYRWTRYHTADQREATIRYGSPLLYSGYVKHYGKAISIDKWDEKCEYYMKFGGSYYPKWKARVGKAIHEKSDFGANLIKWEDRDKFGVPLIKGKPGKRQEFIVCSECGMSNKMTAHGFKYEAYCTNVDCKLYLNDVYKI